MSAARRRLRKERKRLERNVGKRGARVIVAISKLLNSQTTLLRKVSRPELAGKLAVIPMMVPRTAQLPFGS